MRICHLINKSLKGIDELLFCTIVIHMVKVYIGDDSSKGLISQEAAIALISLSNGVFTASMTGVNFQSSNNSSHSIGGIPAQRSSTPM